MSGIESVASAPTTVNEKVVLEEETAIAESAPTTIEEKVTSDEIMLLKEKAALADEYLDQLKRMKADFENYRKRVLQEKFEFIKFANKELITELLPVLDSFERALDHSGEETNIETIEKGIRLIKKEFEEILKKRGLQRLEVVGKPFDPRIHEAVIQKESKDHPDQTIIEEIHPGYMLDGCLLRPAQVVVSKRAETITVESVVANNVVANNNEEVD